MIQRTKEVLVRRMTVKNAILNRRFADRNLCDMSRSAAWKNRRLVFQTPGEPPNRGKIIFAIIGSIRKRRTELRNRVIVKRLRTGNQSSMNQTGIGARHIIDCDGAISGTRAG